MKHKSVLYISVLMALLAAFLCVGAYAVDEVTVTTLDPETGEPIAEGLDTENVMEDTDQVILTASMIYERSSDSFLISSGGVSPEDIRTNVPNGIMTRDSVWIQVPEGTTPVLYRDGIDVTEEGLDSISTPGTYVLDLTGSLSRSVQPFKFTIIGESINTPEIYRVPDGFCVDYVLLDGEDAYTSSIMAEFPTDGIYDIRYSCLVADKSFNLQFVKDTEAPVAILDGLKEDNTARNPVIVSFEESAVIYYLTKDGEVQELLNPIKDSGYYTLSVWDKAGNVNEYAFQIKFYFNSNTILFVLLFGGSVVGLGAYLFLSGKKLRVR